MHGQPGRVALGIFAMLFSVYLLSYSGRVHIVDEAYMLATTESLGKGRLDANQVASMQYGFVVRDKLGAFGPSGDLFGKKGLAISLFALPLLRLLRVVPGIGALHSALLVNSVLTALTGSLLCVYLWGLGFSPRVCTASSLAFGLCTLAWPYARWYLSEPVAGLGLLLAVSGASRYHRRTRAGVFSPVFLCGLGAGLAVLAVPAVAILLPVLLAWLAGSAVCGAGGRGRLLASVVARYALGLAGPLVVMALYNTLRFGVPWDTGYRLSLQDFGLPLYKGLTGLLVSPGRGLMFYSPVTLLALPGAIVGLRKNRFDCSLILLLFGTSLAFYAKWAVWHGGWSWGPRYLVPLLPLTVALVAQLSSVTRGRALWVGALAVLAVLSFLAQLPAVLKNYVDFEFQLQQLSGALADDWYYLGQRALFSPQLSPLVLQWQHIGVPPWDISWLSTGRADSVALVAGLVALLAGVGVLWCGYRPRPHARIAMACLGLVLFAAVPVVLVRATARPFYNIEDSGAAEALSQVVSSARGGDALVSAVPYLYELMMDRYPALPPVYGVRRDQQVTAEMDRLLRRAVASSQRLWFLSVWTRPGDMANETEHWLARHAFPVSASQQGGYRLQLFSCQATSPVLDHAANVLFGEGIKLEHIAAGYDAQGSIVQVSLRWKALEPTAQDYQVFVHLYDGEGHMIGQGDHSPVLGFRPTSTWQHGEVVEDRVGLQVLPLPDGTTCRLAVGLYDLRTGERLEAHAGGGGVECLERAAQVAFALRR